MGFAMVPSSDRGPSVAATEPQPGDAAPIRPLPILPPPAPDVYWTMDRIVQNALPDFTPANEPGVKQSALALVREQQGFLDVAAVKSFDFTNGMTVSAWVKIEDRSALMNILSCAEDVPAPKGGWTLAYSYGNVVFKAVDSVGKLQGVASSKDSVPARAWVHISAVADASMLQIYLNGVEAASAPFAGPIRMADTPMVIGNHAGIGSFRHAQCPAFGGLLDEVKIFQKPLGAAEVMAESESALSPID